MDVLFTAPEIRAALVGKSFEEIVDSVRRALDMALPVCAHARSSGKQNRKRAALIELEWRKSS